MAEGQEGINPTEQMQQPNNGIEDVEKAHEMALAENIVRDWGNRYQQFQENPQAETDPEAADWFRELKSRNIDPSLFVSYAERRGEMVGELHDYEQKLNGMSKTRLNLEWLKTTYAMYFLTLTTLPTVKGIVPAGKIEGLDNPIKHREFLNRGAYNANLAYWKNELVSKRVFGTPSINPSAQPSTQK